MPSALPPLGFHDAGVKSIRYADGTLTLVLDHVQEGEWRAESGHDGITLIDIELAFTGITGLMLDDRPCASLTPWSDCGEVMSLEAENGWASLWLLWTKFHPLRAEHQGYSFSFEGLTCRKLGLSRES